MPFKRLQCLYAFPFPLVGSQRARTAANCSEGNEGEKASELTQLLLMEHHDTGIKCLRPG